MINWGILGTGNIAKTFAKAIKDTSVSNLLAVGSRSKESAEIFSSVSRLWAGRCLEALDFGFRCLCSQVNCCRLARLMKLGD